MTLKVHVLYEHSADKTPYGVSYIRLLLPLSHPTVINALKISQGTEIPKSRVDVVIVERLWRPDITLNLAEQLIESVRRQKARLIYSIDDNLLDLEPDEVMPGFPSLEQKMVVRLFTREANGVLVATERLKERLARLNQNIIVIPNALDERLFIKREKIDRKKSHYPKGKKKIIGYMGTFTHDADLMMILQSLRTILRKHSDVELEIIGGIADQATAQTLFSGLPVRFVNVRKYAEYPRFMRWMAENVRWDLALAPLEDNRFTRCKSDIKFLDYSILGIAGLYSRVPAYENTVRHLETGYLVDNSVKAWTEALEYLMTNQYLRDKLAKKAQEYVYSERILKHCAKKWVNALTSLV